jgi:predicted metalloprotease with PDZ domain
MKLKYFPLYPNFHLMIKTFKSHCCLACLCCLLFFNVTGQDIYRYTVDLTKVEKDQLAVNLITPSVSQNEIIFYLPRIVPGTYMNSNYGKYVNSLKAFDRAGKPLPVNKHGDNGWVIKKAKSLHNITYNVEDTWDATINNMVYPMCGTSFEQGKNFVLNTPGIFGYLDGMRNKVFELTFTKPSGFYGATGLVPVSGTATSDVFRCSNADHLYDSPIMYSVPDTASIKVGTADVLIAVYSPNKLATAQFMSQNMKKLLLGTRDYLGGKLPVDKYAFIFYFNGEQPKLTTTGAWEHSYSSFYALDETPEKESMPYWVSIAAHEFFHIVTPLTISSREVKQFNFNETKLSKHVWLYEGSTEYASQHMQAWTGIITPEQFLENLSQKISYSRGYMNDSLSFTELSTESAGKHAAQYGNVYMKGALISACIDLQLLQWSNAQYGIRNLKHDLGINFGKDKFFEDDSLFSIIAKLSYPELLPFFGKHVAGGTPIPYEKYFALAGVQYLPVENYKDFSLGGLEILPDGAGGVKPGLKDLNAFGKKLGYQEGDILVSINDSAVSMANIDRRLNQLFGAAKEGDLLAVKVRRKNSDGKDEIKILQAPMVKVDKQRKHVLRFMPDAGAEQLRIRNAWLNNHVPSFTSVALPADVNSIDGLIKSLYQVISGPAGPRDWVRFRSLFHPEAYMAAVNEKGELRKFSPAQYVQGNAPFFLKYSFMEKEIGRRVSEFGNIAQVFTSYEYQAGTTPPETKRGINSVELIKEKGRWYIMSITWDEERGQNKIPGEYLK